MRWLTSCCFPPWPSINTRGETATTHSFHSHFDGLLCWDYLCALIILINAWTKKEQSFLIDTCDRMIGCRVQGGGTYERVFSSRPPVEPMISPRVQKVWPRKSCGDRGERVSWMTGPRGSPGSRQTLTDGKATWIEPADTLKESGIKHSL